MAFRDLKRAARRTLHDHMKVAAVYLPNVPMGSDDEPLLIDVRVHTKFDALGDQAGTSLNSAERVEAVPQIIFVDCPFVPQRNAVVSIEPGEAYRLGVIEPNDDISVKAQVVRLPAAQAAGLPVPADFEESGS